MFARTRSFCLGLALVALRATPGAAAVNPAPTLAYNIDLNRRADDLFHVTLRVTGLGPDNAIYQFASTAPGTGPCVKPEGCKVIEPIPTPERWRAE